MKMTPEILLKSLSDQTRLRSLMLLMQEGELCVCELTYALNLIQPKISRHLASLRDIQLLPISAPVNGFITVLIEAYPRGQKNCCRHHLKEV